MKDHRTSFRRPVARKEAFFGLNFTLTAENPTENISLLLSRVRPDYVQLWLKMHLGYLYYRGAQGTTVPDMQGDPLSIWRDKTREHGVKLVAHYTGLWSEADIREHPQWASIKADGTQDTMYASTFGRYVDERLIPQLHEVLTRYGLEGVWMDGDCWAAQLDYSEASLAAWRKETGYGDAPRQRSDPHWHQWKAFQRRQFERYMKLWVDDIHERCPGVGVCDNWAYGPSMPLPLSVAIDWLSGDHSPTDAVDNERMVGRLWSNMGLPWELHAWAFNHGSRTRIPVGTTYKMAEHLKQEAAVPLAEFPRTGSARSRTVAECGSCLGTHHRLSASHGNRWR